MSKTQSVSCLVTAMHAYNKQNIIIIMDANIIIVILLICGVNGP